jgi:hypothetical protein
MNLKRLALLALGTYGLCALWAITGVQGDADTPKIVSTPSTVTVGMLTPQQQQERTEELSTTTTTSTTTSTTTTTQPVTTVVPAALTFKCSEWFPTAISVGWPNNPETLEKLGRLLWKETRCQNVNYLHPMFNGHDHGVAQINEIHRAYVEQLFTGSMEESMSDPTLNLRYAFILYSELEAKGRCGWKPWSLC